MAYRLATKGGLTVTVKRDAIQGQGHTLAIGDLILTEVLQGFSRDKDFREARKELTRLEVVELGGENLVIKAARNYRTLRKLGFTIRKTIDTIIATRCIEDGYTLLHNDADFTPFEKHLGLRVVM
jgi:predicted nucleic acid-binding protein